MENTIIFLACICFLFIIGKIFIVPIKWISKLIFNSIIGALIIIAINLIGGIWGFHIGLNFFTSIMVGILGIPGAICLIVITLLL
jgi:inhibitor of the pro-sigma K processing machinery